MNKTILLIALLFVSALHAKEYSVIYDCSSNKASFVKSRMWLIGKTMDMMQENGDSSRVVLTLHGGCVPMVSEDYDMLVSDKDVKDIEQAQKYLISFSKRENVKIIVCAMSLAAKSISQKEVLPFIEVSKNSFLDTIKYQNEGYALMTFK